MMDVFSKGSPSSRASSKASKGGKGGKKSSCDEGDSSIVFSGVSSVYSVQKGVLQISWSPAVFVSTLDGDPRDCGDFEYHVFVAKAPFDFSPFSLKELIDNEELVTSKTKKTSIKLRKKDFEAGVDYSILVIPAEKKDRVSFEGRKAVIGRVAAADASLRDDVKRVVVDVRHRLLAAQMKSTAVKAKNFPDRCRRPLHQHRVNAPEIRIISPANDCSPR